MLLRKRGDGWRTAAEGWGRSAAGLELNLERRQEEKKKKKEGRRNEISKREKENIWG